DKQPDLEPAVDPGVAQDAFQTLMRPDTGVMAYPYFIYALQQEFARHRRVQHAFSLVLFDLEPNEKAKIQLEIDALIESFAAMQEEFELFAHFEESGTREFAILLPYRTPESAYFFVDKFAFSLLTHGAMNRASLHFSIASMPNDGTDMNSLVVAATRTKEMAREQNRLIATVSGINLGEWENLRQRGDLAITKEQLDEAADSWLKALEEAEQFEPSDPRLVITLDRLSSIYMAQHKPQLAEPVLQYALELRAPQGDSIETVFVLDQLSKCFYEQKKFSEAEETLFRSVQMCKALFGAEHEAVGSVFFNLATLYHVQDNYEQAKSAYERSLHIKRKVLGREHPEA
ncbi:MAG: tetratricopeptide repeat protein, partial [Terriglobales bacterium]